MLKVTLFPLQLRHLNVFPFTTIENKFFTPKTIEECVKQNQLTKKVLNTIGCLQ